MRGGAQSHLVRCSDGHSYVVKFANNPQHRRVLANEWLAGRLAQAIGLPVPSVAMVQVGSVLVEKSPGLKIRVGKQLIACANGLQFGSRVPTSSPCAPIYDQLSRPALSRVENLSDFVGMLLFDQWTCNCDMRQVIFCQGPSQDTLRAYMVDQGSCFNRGSWSFPDSPLRGIYRDGAVYAGISRRDSVEPWLIRLESLSDDAIVAAGQEAPEEWYGRWPQILRLLEQLTLRRHLARNLLRASLELLPLFCGYQTNSASAEESRNFMTCRKDIQGGTLPTAAPSGPV